MKEGVLTEFVSRFRVHGSPLWLRLAMRAQFSRLRADCEVSCAKRSNKRTAAALKSCTMLGVGRECMPGGG